MSLQMCATCQPYVVYVLLTMCSFVDALHAYFGVCGLALLGEPSVNSMHASLNVSRRAADFLHSIHRIWKPSTYKPPLHSAGKDKRGELDDKRLPSSASLWTAKDNPPKVAVVKPIRRLELIPEKHVRFFLQCIKGLPGTHTAADSSRYVNMHKHSQEFILILEYVSQCWKVIFCM